jgi:hypothetical protein
MTNPSYRHIAIVMDRSGSMSSTKTDTEGGLASMLEGLAAESLHTTVSLYQFDDRYEPVYEMTNINGVPRYELIPRNTTALLDAVGRTIAATGEHLAQLPEEERPGVVIVIIATDGLENASREYTRTQVKEMITHQREVYDWRFMFLGADQDAFTAAEDIGIARGQTLSYASASTVDSYGASRSLASRLTTNSCASYTSQERATASGLSDQDEDLKGTGA